MDRRRTTSQDGRRGDGGGGQERIPDDLDEFAHVDVVGHQELGLVQHGKLLLPFIPLDDHLQREDESGSTLSLVSGGGDINVI